MRFRELLLEYDHSVTVRNYGVKLRDRLKSDKSRKAVRFILATQDEYSEAFPSTPLGPEKWGAFMQDKAVAYIEAFDPTRMKKYTVWMINRYCSGGIAALEDMSKAEDYLLQFDKLKNSGHFRRHPEDARFADINQFKTLSDLGAFVIQHSAKSNASADREKEQELYQSGQATLLHNDNRFKVVIPRTEEASCYFGRNTQWCTAATTSQNMFSEYEGHTLYIVLEKTTNRRWQLCPSGEQYMDENDHPIDWDTFPKDFFEVCKLPLCAKEKINVVKEMSGLKNQEDFRTIWSKEVLNSMTKDEVALLIASIDGSLDNVWEWVEAAKKFDHIEPTITIKYVTVDNPDYGPNLKMTFYYFGPNVADLIIWLVKNSPREFVYDNMSSGIYKYRNGFRKRPHNVVVGITGDVTRDQWVCARSTIDNDSWAAAPNSYYDRTFTQCIIEQLKSTLK